MRISKKVIGLLLAMVMMIGLLPVTALEASASNMFENSDFIETEQPELNEETKKLI